MAIPKLTVELTAKIDNLRDNFNKAVSAANNWDTATLKALNDVDKGFAKLANDVERSSNSVSKSLAKAAAQTATSGKAISAGSNQAAFALTNLGRVAQDAPFGFIGIQNNINPLLESFQQLKAQSGSTSLALKALGASLIGPAGLGLALSLITSGITLYVQSQQKANKATQDAKKTTDDYISTLDVLTAAQLKGAQNAQKELVQLKSLYNVATDTTQSLKQRRIAVDELQEKYPSYFKNIKDETILTGGASKAYEGLKNSILATARARAAQDIIARNSSRQLENEQKLINLERERTRLKIQQSKAANAGIEDVRTSTREAAGLKAAQQVNDINALLNENLEKQNSLKTDTKLLTEQNLRLEKEVNTEVKKGGDLTSDYGKGVGKSGRDIKTVSDVVKELNLNLAQTKNDLSLTFDQRTQKDISDTRKAIDDLTKINTSQAINEIQKLVKSISAINFNLRGREANNIFNNLVPERIAESEREKAKTALEKFYNDVELDQEQASRTIRDNGSGGFLFFDTEVAAREFDRIQGIISNFNSQVSEALKNGAISTFVSLGEVIGNSLVNGGNLFDALGKSILSSIGDILVQFGKLTVAAGVASTALGKALRNPLNPASGGAAIAAGIALVAIGAAVRAFGSKNSTKGNNGGATDNIRSPIPQFASGVNNFSGGLALVGERGAELVNLPTGSDVIPNNRTMNMLQGNKDVNVNLSGGVSISGDELVLFIDRERKKLNRKGYNG